MENEMILKAFRALSDSKSLHIIEFLSRMKDRNALLDEVGRVKGPLSGDTCCYVSQDRKEHQLSKELFALEEAGPIRIKGGRADAAYLAKRNSREPFANPKLLDFV